MTKYIHEGLKLYTDQDYFGVWHCTDESYDGAPDAGEQCVGCGNTEKEAMADYKDRAKIYYLHEDQKIFMEKIDELINSTKNLNDFSIAEVLQIVCDYHKSLKNDKEDSK